LKQSETKDQTGKGTKIKGSNYNLSGGLDYKNIRTSKDQIRNIHFDRKTAPFQSTISSPFFTAVSADSGAISATKTADCFNYEECFMATIPLHAERCTAGHSLAYKSQRKTMKEGRQKHRKKKEREGRRTWRIKRNRGKHEGELSSIGRKKQRVGNLLKRTKREIDRGRA
jgi:hypothetical protein